jgi:hypothetical protein
MLKDSIKVLIIAGCSVWCRFLGCMIFGFRLGSMVMYLCMSQSIYVSKSCGGGWRGVVDCMGRW